MDDMWPEQTPRNAKVTVDTLETRIDDWFDTWARELRGSPAHHALLKAIKGMEEA